MFFTKSFVEIKSVVSGKYVLKKNIAIASSVKMIKKKIIKR